MRRRELGGCLPLACSALRGLINVSEPLSMIDGNDGSGEVRYNCRVIRVLDEQNIRRLRRDLPAAASASCVHKRGSKHIFGRRRLFAFARGAAVRIPTDRPLWARDAERCSGTAIHVIAHRTSTLSADGCPADFVARLQENSPLVREQIPVEHLWNTAQNITLIAPAKQ